MNNIEIKMSNFLPEHLRSLNKRIKKYNNFFKESGINFYKKKELIGDSYIWNLCYSSKRFNDIHELRIFVNFRLSILEEK